jgi:serine/threonine-protein kinase
VTTAPRPPPVAPPPSPAEPPEAGAGPPATLAVLVRPYAQRALLDGVEVASGAQRVVFTLTPGRPHRVQIEHACCEPFVREFPATPALPPTSELRVPLTPRPARLRVEAEADARVLVDGRIVGTAGESLREPLAVAVPANGSTPYEGAAELRIEAPGRPAHVTTAKLRAGAELNVVVPRAVPPPPAAEEAPLDGEEDVAGGLEAARSRGPSAARDAALHPGDDR